MKDQKYILWDHDGVLVDTEKWYYKATCKALSELGITVDKEEYLDFMQDGKSMWTKAYEEGFPEDVIRIHREKRNGYYQEYLAGENIEIPGVEDVLETLGRSFSMAIVTTSKRKDFELIHKTRSIVGFMDFVLTVEDYHSAKPHPEPYLTALKRYGAEPAEAVVIEDSGRGLRSAVAAGIDCIIIENEFTSSHDFSNAARVLKSISELPNLFLS
jgi:HAD superfamily hydrolase (TIGR01509 family)